MGDVMNEGSRERPRWYCRYIDVDGKRKHRATSQPTKQLAKNYLAEVEARIARGEIGIVEPTSEQRAWKTITVKTLSERFLAEYSPPRIKSLVDYRVEARSVHNVRILPALGARAAADVKPVDVERLRDAQLADGLASNSVINTLRALSRLYTWAHRVRLIDCPNPVAGIERPVALPLSRFSCQG